MRKSVLRTVLRYITLSAALLMALLFSILSASAMIDLLNPVQGIATNNTTLVFEYYAGMANVTSCGITVNSNSFADPDAQGSAINSVEIQGIAPGAYSWNATCSNETGGETSATRAFSVDTQPPTIAIVSPANGTTQRLIPLDMIPNDDTASMLSCAMQWNGQELETASIVPNTHYARNYTGTPGNGTLRINCTDAAGNSVVQERAFLLMPEFGLQLSTDQNSYGIDDPVHLTITTLDGSNVTVDICPDQQGFVQCATALLASTDFPQTITLPRMNRTGQYLVEGTALFAGQTRINRTRYNITNSMSVRVTTSETPALNSTFTMTVTPSGGVAPYRITWQLPNGTTVTGQSSLSVIHAQAGNYTHHIMVMDAANNTRQVNYTYEIEPRVTISVRALDASNGQAIAGAEVSMDDGDHQSTARTGTDGFSYHDVSLGTYDMLASAPGYAYAMQQVSVSGTNGQIFTITLRRDNTTLPVVTLIAPAAGSAVSTPVDTRFSVLYDRAVNCTVYTSADGSWFAPNASMMVSGAGTQQLSLALAPGSQHIRVECADTQTPSRTGASATVAFTATTAEQAVGQDAAPQPTATAAPTSDDAKLQAAQDQIDALLNGIANYGGREKEAIDLLGYEQQLRNTKRAVQQAIRDLNDLQYRSDIAESDKGAERQRIVGGAQQLLLDTPYNITVVDTKSFVRYLREEEKGNVSQQLAGLGGLSMDPKVIARHIMDDQQKFTISTKAIQVSYGYADGTSKSITVVRRSFTYAKNLSPDYAIYEIIPKEVAKSAQELTLLSKAEVLKSDPVLRFGTEDTMVYIIPKSVDLSVVEDIRTILLRPYAKEESMMTGFAIFGAGDIAGIDTRWLLLLGAVLLLYIGYYFDLHKHLQFLFYRFGKKSKTHYVRVLINDANDNLEANNYEKADMLYKEIRLTYDTLPLFAKNELYDDILELLQKMDSYYFNLIMIELDGHIRAGELEAAIRSYEKLTGVYARMGPAQQEKLIAAVTAIGRRLGLEAAS
jgi:hypothetical protein